MRTKKLIEYFRKIICIMTGMIALFFCLQVAVFCIPEKYMLIEQKETEEVFAEEGTEWEFIFSYARGAQLDNRTDDAMIQQVFSDPNNSVIYRAMDCNGYPRYWHGYLVFLKPLMVVLSYSQIRYLYMLLYLFSYTTIVLMISKSIDKKAAYAWGIALAMVYFIILPFSLQYSSVFFVTFLAMFIMDKRYRGYNLEKTGIFFLIVGMITSFVDFLTAPLLTLGIPLIYLMLLQQKDYKENSCKKNLLSMLVASIHWGTGYLVNWFSKWIIASLVLKRNVITEGILQGFSRMGSEQEAGSRIDAIAYNLFAILPPGITGNDLKWFGILVAVIMLLIIGLLVKFHETKSVLLSQLPFAIIMVYPYIWYCIMANHSLVHYVFTYRIQMITIWAGLIVILNSVKKK